MIDFGPCGYDDGAGDESLDEFIIPEWERENRLEPRTYQDQANSGDYPMYQPDSSSSAYPIYHVQEQLRHAYGQPFVKVAGGEDEFLGNEEATVSELEMSNGGGGFVDEEEFVEEEYKTPVASSSAPIHRPSSMSSAFIAPRAIPPSFTGTSSHSPSKPAPRPHVPSKFEAHPSTAGVPSTSHASRSSWGPEAFEERKRGEEMRRIRTRNEAQRTGKKSPTPAAAAQPVASRISSGSAAQAQVPAGEEMDEDEWA